MTHKPVIPMTPDALPQQRIHEVVELPERPEGLTVKVDYGLPADMAPKAPPRFARHLASVEWAWSPMNSRFDAYYLHRGKAYWTLWTRYFDDYWGSWEWGSIAGCQRKGVSLEQAAVYLLMEFWKEMAESEYYDQFHWITEPGYLSVDELFAIARQVWD